MSFFRNFLRKRSNLIDTGTTIEGDIHAETDVVIDGKLIGNLTVLGDVIVGSSAEIVGNITGENVRVSGKVSGDISANRNLHLASSCTVDGKIRYCTLEVEEGANLIASVVNGAASGFRAAAAEVAAAPEAEISAVLAADDSEISAADGTEAAAADDPVPAVKNSGLPAEDSAPPALEDSAAQAADDPVPAVRDIRQARAEPAPSAPAAPLPAVNGEYPIKHNRIMIQ